MKRDKDIIKIFSKIKCNRCDNFFDKNSIEVLRKEDFCDVVKIVCSKCQKDFGISILASEDGFDDNKNLPKINYDDVLNAHEFFSNIEEDWTKYINKTEI